VVPFRCVTLRSRQHVGVDVAPRGHCFITGLGRTSTSTSMIELAQHPRRINFESHSHDAKFCGPQLRLNRIDPLRSAIGIDHIAVIFLLSLTAFSFSHEKRGRTGGPLTTVQSLSTLHTHDWLGPAALAQHLAT
jgi:hypothetical protein